MCDDNNDPNLKAFIKMHTACIAGTFEKATAPEQARIFADLYTNVAKMSGDLERTQEQMRSMTVLGCIVFSATLLALAIVGWM